MITPLEPATLAPKAPYATDLGWSQTGSYPGYYLGHGPTLPPKHFSTYDLGFMTRELPMELGGEIPGNQSRFAGAPNQ